MELLFTMIKKHAQQVIHYHWWFYIGSQQYILLLLEAAFCEHEIITLKDPKPVIVSITFIILFNECISTLFVLLNEYCHTLFHRCSKWSARCNCKGIIMNNKHSILNYHTFQYYLQVIISSLNSKWRSISSLLRIVKDYQLLHFLSDTNRSESN